jgi:hypothetical protein
MNLFPNFPWLHGLALLMVLLILTLFKEGVRTWISDNIAKKFIAAILAFWRTLFGKDTSGVKPKREKLLTMEMFTEVMKEHNAGEAKTMSVILNGQDQLGRIVSDAAIQVADRVKEMREDNKLITLALTGHREEQDRKIGEIHERINAQNKKIDHFTGAVEAVIDIAKGNIVAAQQKNQP